MNIEIRNKKIQLDGYFQGEFENKFDDIILKINISGKFYYSSDDFACDSEVEVETLKAVIIKDNNKEFESEYIFEIEDHINSIINDYMVVEFTDNEDINISFNIEEDEELEEIIKKIIKKGV